MKPATRSNPLVRTLAIVWRWSLVVTVPIGCLFAVWFVRTVERYADFGIRYDTLSDHANLHHVGIYEAKSLKRDIQLAASPNRRREPARIRTIQLFVPEASEAQLNSNLPHSGRDYVEASLAYPDGEIREIDLRYKGDHFWHWAARKKSLRVKTKKRHLYERMRSFSLNAPKRASMIGELLSYELGHDIGVISPDVEFCEVWLNGEYRGIHIMVEQLEEMVLRKSGRMPGDLFSADMVPREMWHTINPRVYWNAGLWEKKAINNHFADDEDANLRLLIAILDEEPSVDRTRRLRDIVDYDAFAKFHAFRLICQSRHYDKTHNHRIYYDPWRNQFEPIVWDPIGWTEVWLPQPGRTALTDILTNRLDDALFTDPLFLAARQRAMEDWFAGGGPERIVERAVELTHLIDPSIDRDAALSENFQALTPTQVRAGNARIILAMQHVLDDLERAFLSAPEALYASTPEYPQSFRLEVDGHSIFHRIEVEFERPLDANCEAALICATDAELEPVDISGALSQNGRRLTIDLPFGPQWVIGDRTSKRNYPLTPCRPEAVTYDFVFKGADLSNNPITCVTGIAPRGESVTIAKADGIIPAIPFESALEFTPPIPRTDPIVWSGEVTVEGVQTIERDLRIEPGTRITMEPNASIIAQGRVMARGTKERPIRIEPAVDTRAPWGVFAVRGEATSGSMFQWCEFRFGSGLKTTRAEFSAMFSVHDTQNVVVENCSFEDSQPLDGYPVDDMVHVVYSGIRFEACTFERSFMDAVDIDISEAAVIDCTFIDAGNDALDLMTSIVAVTGTKLHGSGDKGISIGEDTKAFIHNCAMIDCNIGAQIKDRSEASIVHCDIRGNEIGVDAYKKNWRYDSGGVGYLYYDSIVDNGVQVSADQHSRIMLNDCYVAPMTESTENVVVDAMSNDRQPKDRTADFKLRFPAERQTSPAFFAAFWADVRHTVRGVDLSD